MPKKINISMPVNPITPEIIEQKNKRLFSEDFNKNGVLAKVFIFCYQNEPVSVTELTKKINQYYYTDIDRVNIYRALQKLTERRIMHMAGATYIASIPQNERNKVHEEVLIKYHRYIKGLPEQFRKRYQEINFFWVANGDGLKYIDWCCNLLGFKIEEQK